MIHLTLPDGRILEYENPPTGLEIAKSISQRLGKEALAISVDGKTWDLSREIIKDASINILTWEQEEGKKTFWHSSAHLLAEALQELYPDVKFGIGPAIGSGFYYDIDLGEKRISEDDLDSISKKVMEKVKKNSVFSRKEVSKEEAVTYFTSKNDHLKLDLIKDLQDGEITFYTQGDFTDLCKGPHLPDSSYIKALKLTSLAGAYWRGDENNQVLTRIYGVSFPKQKDLEDHILMLEEAKKRDHRKIGKEMEIFTFDDDVGPGLPLWMPNGAAMIEKLEELAKKTERLQGYQRVRTPHLAKESMYLTSGHLPYYEDSMFPPMEVDGTKYYLKSMNCPHHHKIYDAVPRSYKDLPIRLAEYGTCYRYEKSGELFGLMRVRCLQMNDAHIYCTEAQFEEEFRKVNELYLKYFKIFSIDKYVMRFSTHEPSKLGKKYVDNPELWLKTENMVRDVLIKSGIPYIEVPDEAAFYGPKIDVQVWSAIGREFTLATNQVDFSQPKSFGLTYRNSSNQDETPLIIHRAPLGTHERFIGFLIEHYAGDFPVWLAPVQVAVLPIIEKFNDYAQKVVQELNNHEIRTFFDNREEKIGRKIRESELKKIPIMLIIGEKEENEGTVTIRRRKVGDEGSFTVEEFLNRLKEEERTQLQ